MLLPGVGVRATNVQRRGHQPVPRRAPCSGAAAAAEPAPRPGWSSARSRRSTARRRPTPPRAAAPRGAAPLQRRVALAALRRSPAPSPWSTRCCGPARSPSSSAPRSTPSRSSSSRSSSASPAAPRSRRACRARSRRPVAWLAGVHLGDGAPMIGLSYLVMDKLPAAFLGLLRGGTFSVDGIIFCQFLLAALAVLPATLCMGGVMPLTMRIFTRSAPTGRPRRRHRLLGEHARRHPRLVRRRLRRAARRSACSAASASAPSPPSCSRRSCSWSHGRAPRRFVAAVAPAAPSRSAASHVLAALEPAPLLGGPVPRLDRQGHHRVEQVGAARARSTTTTASPPPSRVEKWGKTSRSRTTARSTPRTATTWRRRSWSACMPFVFSPAPGARPSRRASRSSASARASPSAPSRSSPSATPTSSSSSRRWSTPATASSAPSTTMPEQDPRVHVLIGDGRNFLTPGVATSTTSSSPSRRTRGSPASPTCSPSTTGSWRARASPTTASSASGRSSTRCRRRTSRRILRSFAEVFPYTYVFSAEDLSCDVILVATQPSAPARRARAARATSRRRPCAPSSSAAASSRPRTSSRTCCSRPKRSPPSPPARRSTPTTTPSSSSPRRAICSARRAPPIRTWRASTPPNGPTAASIATSSGSATATSAWKTELRLSRSLLAHGKRSRGRSLLARARSATARRPTRARRDWRRCSASATTDDREIPLAAAEDDPTRALAALDSAEAAGEGRCPTTSTSSAPSAGAPGRTRSCT